jgi:hypothetical protein
VLQQAHLLDLRIEVGGLHSSTRPPPKKVIGSPWPCGYRRPPAINLAGLSVRKAIYVQRYEATVHKIVHIARRPRAEDCLRITGAGIRLFVAPGALHHRLNDGTALAMGCPACSQTVRVLRKPPGEGWSCRNCRPVSHRSHRRSGASRGNQKPWSWRIAQVCDEQGRIAEMLGLEQWPPARLLWSLQDLEGDSRLPDAPRLSAERRMALERRLNALEDIRICTFAPLIRRERKALGSLVAVPNAEERYLAAAERQLAETSWAIRRQARDPRTARQKESSCLPCSS